MHQTQLPDPILWTRQHYKIPVCEKIKVSEHRLSSKYNYRIRINCVQCDNRIVGFILGWEIDSVGKAMVV